MTDLPTSNQPHGVIESVLGRADDNGIPELSQAVFRMNDGSKLEARMPRPNGTEVNFQALPVAFKFIDFGVCPICLDPDPGSREHVPPYTIGGKALTMTCERCNNEFGAKYEPHLRDWYEGSIGKVRLSGEGVKGNRFAGEYLLRENPAGGFVLFQQGDRDPAVDQILQSGSKFEMRYSQADGARAHVSAVKSAYLAACLAARRIPRTPRSDALRCDLLAARDMPRTQRFELSDLMKSIRVARSAATPASAEILLMATTNADGGTRFALGFNRVFAVDWPLDPITSFTEQRIP